MALGDLNDDNNRSNCNNDRCYTCNKFYDIGTNNLSVVQLSNFKGTKLKFKSH